MNTAQRIAKHSFQTRRRLVFCGLVWLLGLQSPYSEAAPTTTLSDSPLVLATPTHPQVLLLLNNSQSMDGNLSGAIMTGATGTYTIPAGFTPPVDGSANYTVTVSGQLQDNSDSRMNVAKASIKQILNDYASSNDFGLMTLTTPDAPARYNTWVYYMSSPTSGFTFTNIEDTTNGTTYPNPCYPPIATNISSTDCAALAGHYGMSASTLASYKFVVAAGPYNGKSDTPGSSDDPQVNDVLYAGPPHASSLPSVFVSYSGPSPSNPYTGYTLAQYNAGGVFEGYAKTTPNIGRFGTSPTNAGFVPYSPEVLYVTRGFGYYNAVANTTGTLRVPIAPDSTTRQATFATLLAPETDSESSGEIKSSAVNAATAGMLSSAYNYYTGTSPAAPGVSAISPPPNNKNNNCDTKKYVVLITDGLPTWDLNGNAWPPLGSLSATGYGVTAPIDSNGAVITTGPGATNNQAVIDAVAQITALKNKGILTYVIGMGAGVTPDLNKAAAATLKAMAVAGGTGDYFPAKSPADVSNDMIVILEQIKAANTTTTSAGVNSSSINTLSAIYQATFNSQDTNKDWTGDLQKFSVTGGVISLKKAAWSAQTELDKLNWNTGSGDTARRIVTFDPTLAAGVPFRWPVTTPASGVGTVIGAAQVALLQTSSSDTLGQSRLNYLRGDKSNEQGSSPPGTFRTRTHLLGDIEDSTPLYVGAPSALYQDGSYQSFQAANNKRDPMIYVGANDGMLHAFCASTTSSCAAGVERFAFIPNGVFGRLINLTQPAYNAAHKFYVNGSPVVGDVQFKIADTNWHTLLLGGLNNGGNSIYALDVTKPPTSSDTEATIAKKILWEFTDTNLGRTYSRPTTARITIGSGSSATTQFVAIFGSGYNNANGKPYLYVVNAETGALIQKVDVCGGSTACDSNVANGLSSPVAVSPDGSGLVTMVYAGDLQGNLWKVMLPATGTWSGTLIFKAKDGSGTPQPITTMPVITLHPNAPQMAGNLVLFGTGRFLGAPDIADTSQQSVYGIWDNSWSTAPTRTDLVVQTITQVTTAKTLVNGTNQIRVISSSPIDWTKKKGWYIDLPVSGERAVTDAILDSSRFIFTTYKPFVPTNDKCIGDGQSWLMLVDYATGGAPSKAMFDLYGNKTYPKIDITDGSDAGDGTGSNDLVPVGMLLGNFYVATPTFVAGLAGGQDTLLPLPSMPVNIRPGTRGRQSWIQLQ
ncbi:MAG: pilus assembly protein [Gammaproteobacteria bacterium]